MSIDFKKYAVPAAVVLFMALVLFAANVGRSDMELGSIALNTGDVKTPEEIQAELDAAGLNAGVELYINSNIVMLDGKSTANLLIQNSEHNKSNQQVYIYLEDNLENSEDSDESEPVCLYKSDIIPPGYKIESAHLKQVLDKGEHIGRVEFHVLDSDGADKAIINAHVNITVLS